MRDPQVVSQRGRCAESELFVNILVPMLYIAQYERSKKMPLVAFQLSKTITEDVLINSPLMFRVTSD